MSQKKKLKKLLKGLEAINIPESILYAMIEDFMFTKKILIRSFRSKEKDYYNTKTKYGLLYTTFNNMKIKLNLVDYSMRNEFIDWFINDDEFNEMFDRWANDNFEKQFKPSLIIIKKELTKENIHLLPYGEIWATAHGRSNCSKWTTEGGMLTPTSKKGFRGHCGLVKDHS